MTSPTPAPSSAAVPDGQGRALDAALADAALTDVLARLVGPGATPRPDQAEPVRELLGGARVLCVQATGWGKSTVYFAATRALRSAGCGPTLVISPLLALMRDQVESAERAGLRAVSVNSANVDDWDDVFAALSADEVDCCFISPERLAAPSFQSRVPELLDRVALVVVDEAHCISDWGHDFRPDYRRLADVIAHTHARVLATTATANARVCADVATQLGDDTVMFRGSLSRPSLRCAVVPGLDALGRYAWVADALDALDGVGIVYALTVAETERLAGFLVECGHHVLAYSSKLTADERLAAESALRSGAVKALVATSALGMGYDHPELAFVIHVGAPSSPVAYYQQIGRAGRALDDALAVLLPAASDEELWEWFQTASIPDPDQADAVLAACTEPTGVVALESATGIRRGRLEALCKILAVDGALARDGSAWRATDTPWQFDAPHYAALVEARRAEADVMRAYMAGTGCLMEFLQRALDDPHAGPCGRCSVCTGELPNPGLTPSDAQRARARAFLRSRDVVLDPRKRWPAGIRTGMIAGAGPGRAVAFADDPAFPDISECVTGPDGPVSDAVVATVVAALGRWSKSWGPRPVCVVPIPSRHAPQRVRSLAAAIGAAGRLPVLDALVIDGPAPPSDVASGVRADALLSSLHATGATLPDGPVLLVDDTYRSGWTMTVAASVLREAGAVAVYPFVLQQLP